MLCSSRPTRNECGVNGSLERTALPTPNLVVVVMDRFPLGFCGVLEKRNPPQLTILSSCIQARHRLLGETEITRYGMVYLAMKWRD